MATRPRPISYVTNTPFTQPKTGMLTTEGHHLLMQIIARLNTMTTRGLRADQPPADQVPPGSLYAVSDENVVERSNGVVWQTFKS